MLAEFEPPPKTRWSRRSVWLQRRIGLREEGGQAVILLAVALPLMLMLCALVVDGSGLFVNRQALQNAADAAAMAAAQGLAKDTTCSNACVASLTGEYSGLNDATPTEDPLQQCPDPSGNCYSWPYQDDPNRVEVQLRKKIPTLFGGVLGIPQVDVSVRAVASLNGGSPPPITFAALDDEDEGAALKVRAGGDLTVDNAVYVNSRTDTDAFDIRGDGSTMTAKSISVVGGWNAGGSTIALKAVGPGGPTCDLTSDAAGAPQNPPSTPPALPAHPGCPIVQAAPTVDPFANGRLTPPRASATQCEPFVDYQASPFSPPQTLNASISASATTLRVSGGVILPGDVIQVEDERMLVITVTPVGGNQEDIRVARAQLGTTAAAHTELTVPVSRKGRIGTTATLTTAGDHGLAVGQKIAVNIGDATFDGNATVTAVPSPTRFRYTTATNANVPSNTVTAKQLTGTTVTLTTLAAHGLNVGDVVTVDIGDNRFDGTFTITAVPGPSKFEYTKTVAGGGSVTREQLDHGVATLTTAAAHALQVGDSVDVTGVDSTFDGAYTVTAVPTARTFSYAKTIPNTTLDVTSKSSAAGVDTLTTATPHNLVAGDVVTVDIGDPRFDGAHMVSAVPSPSTFSYTSPFPDANASTKALAGGVATLTTDSPHHLLVGDRVRVTTGDGNFDGAFTVTATPSATTFRYAASPAALPVTSKAAAAGVATLTTSGAHHLQVGDTVDIAIGDPRFDGAHTITAAPSGNEFSYALAPIAVSSWKVTSDVATLTATTPPHGLRAGDAVTVTFGPGAVFLNGTHTLTAVTASTFSFAMTHGNQTGNENGSVTIASVSPSASGTATAVTVATATASGPVTLAGTAVAAGNTVSVPGFVTSAAVSPAGTATLTGVSLSADSGTVAGGSVPTSGTVAEGPLIPILLVIDQAPHGPFNPRECTVTSGAATLQPGTYYGGICIGPTGPTDVDHPCKSTDTAGNCESKADAPVADVTLLPGTYIMAGGGFHVCGASTLSAPHVLIYNTRDVQRHSGELLPLDQVELNTTGSVTLGPQTTGDYPGLTIFQEPGQAVNTVMSCDAKTSDPLGLPQLNTWDIALRSMAPTVADGPLGSISGTIYAPGRRALFADTVGGTANLAVITSCIYVGANAASEFKFNQFNSRLFGIGPGLTE